MPDLPEHLERVYEAFTLLSETRHYDQGMPHRIKLSDIAAYFQFYPSTDSAWIVDLIISIDKTFIDGIANKGKSKQIDQKDPRLKKRR